MPHSSARKSEAGSSTQVERCAKATLRSIRTSSFPCVVGVAPPRIRDTSPNVLLAEVALRKTYAMRKRSPSSEQRKQVRSSASLLSCPSRRSRLCWWATMAATLATVATAVVETGGAKATLVQGHQVTSTLPAWISQHALGLTVTDGTSLAKENWQSRWLTQTTKGEKRSAEQQRQQQQATQRTRWLTEAGFSWVLRPCHRHHCYSHCRRTQLHYRHPQTR